MAKLYIHIGLPKTATTALQRSFFPLIESDSLCYAGVIQPRSVAQNLLYESFFQAIDHGGNAIDAVRQVIVEKLHKGQSLIFSEEMILVSGPQAGWRDKLARLAALVEDLDYELILTVRDPARALFSYYVEILPDILRQSGKPGNDSGFLIRAKSDPRMEIFHYKKLLDEIGEHFDLSRLFIMKFEEIVAGHLGSLLRLFGLPEELSPGKLPVENRRKESGGYVYTGEMATLGELLLARCARHKPANPGIRRIPYRLCHSVARRLKIKLPEIKVKRPDQREMDEISHYLQREIDWLAQTHGVDYRSG